MVLYEGDLSDLVLRIKKGRGDNGASPSALKASSRPALSRPRTQRYRQQAGPHDGRGAQAFKLVEQLELHGSSIGFANAEAVFNGSKLTTLKLGGIVPGHSGPYADGANLLARTPPPGFHSTLTVLTLFQCQLAEEEFDTLFTSLPSLHTLTLF